MAWKSPARPAAAKSAIRRQPATVSSLHWWLSADAGPRGAAHGSPGRGRLGGPPPTCALQPQDRAAPLPAGGSWVTRASPTPAGNGNGTLPPGPLRPFPPSHTTPSFAPTTHVGGSFILICEDTFQWKSTQSRRDLGKYKFRKTLCDPVTQR